MSVGRKLVDTENVGWVDMAYWWFGKECGHACDVLNGGGYRYGLVKWFH